MHVKRVEIYGFKSFGPRNTVVDFRPGLVSIAGSNGSGKSNVLDAIIFAMGEKRPRMMRVGSLRSLIHERESGVSGARMARASVLFDNADRGIPVDSDTVEVTREMDAQGENTYYLNRKRAQRGRIADLMDAAGATLNNYNVVQQQAVTRIAEESPEDKRRAIEDMVGLASFDEKKREAEERLRDADTRLSIAMAKMGEIKDRVDTLEVQRNRKLRRDMVDGELARLRAVAAAGELRGVAASRDAKQAELEALRAEMAEARDGLGSLGGQIAALEAEKAAFMAEADAHGRASEELDRGLDEAARGAAAAGARMAEGAKRAERAEARLPGLREEAQKLRAEAAAAEPGLERARRALAEAAPAREALAERARGAGARIEELGARQAGLLERRAELDGRAKELADAVGAARLEQRTAEAGARGAAEAAGSAVAKLAEFDRGLASLREQKPRLEAAVRAHLAAEAELGSRLAALEAKKSRIEAEIEDLGLMLEKSSRAGTKYDTKIRLVRGMMHEEYSAARLRDSAEQLGILGLAYELVTWGPEHERAMLAAGSDWIKATVVRDFGTLASLAEYARYKGLPKLRIIPLEAIPRLRPDLPDRPGVVGALSDFARCDRRYEPLRSFLFGNVILASSREAALALSRDGYKAVTAAGEFFEPTASAAVIDTDSRISKIARIISMSSSVEGLMRSVALLRRHLQKRRRALGPAEAGIRSCRERLGLSRAALGDARGSLGRLEAQLASKSQVRRRMEGRLADLRAKRARLEGAAAGHARRAASLEAQAGREGGGGADGELRRLAAELARLGREKSGLDARRDAAARAEAGASSGLARLEADARARADGLRRLDAEAAAAAAEAAEARAGLGPLGEEKARHDARMAELREREQELAASPAGSVSRIRGFDERLGGLRARERALSNRAAQLGRREVSLQRDVEQLGRRGEGIQSTLDSYGYDGETEEFDVGPLLRELEAERRSLEEINAMAPAEYAERASGYRSMSSRKNSLEAERDRIVGFIEGFERDKRQTFLDAFDKVDREVRGTFKEMTGGEAWLELGDEDDVFSSGMSYMVRLPDKPKRESTSLSGGEKALAGITFILAMQKLRPSPFYIFDEIDSPLDAQNVERLSKLLAGRSAESQFIMVSHKAEMVSKAGLIYGVYNRGGSSHVLAYKDKRLPPMAAG